MLEIKFDKTKVRKRISKDIGNAQFLLDQRIAADSNYYCPFRDGDLERSVLNSKFGSGKLVWDKAYAQNQYYRLPNKSKDKNPNASTKWFERAKEVKIKDWERIANDGYNR